MFDDNDLKGLEKHFKEYREMDNEDGSLIKEFLSM